jgi:hypothetical protein
MRKKAEGRLPIPFAGGWMVAFSTSMLSGTHEAFAASGETVVGQIRGPSPNSREEGLGTAAGDWVWRARGVWAHSSSSSRMRWEDLREVPGTRTHCLDKPGPEVRLGPYAPTPGEEVLF